MNRYASFICFGAGDDSQVSESFQCVDSWSPSRKLPIRLPDETSVCPVAL